MKKISIITPTYGRGECMENLYNCFRHQTYENRELLVWDDSPGESAFLRAISQTDPRVRYFYNPKRVNNGQKRNLLAREATGEIIMHFDDDDYYAPAYAETMIDHLANYDLVKLSGWYCFDCRNNFFGYWDTSRRMPFHFQLCPNAPLQALTPNKFTTEVMESYLWGYGFTYAYYKRAWETTGFDDVNFGSDYTFIQKLIKQSSRLACFPDEVGLSLHVIHQSNVSKIFPQYALPGFMLEGIFGDNMARYTYPRLYTSPAS